MFVHLHLFSAVLYCHLWTVWLYHILLRYPRKARFSRKNLLNIKCVFWFSLQLLSETFLILRRIQRDTVRNVRMCSVRYPLFLSVFRETWIFSTGFRKKKYQIYWKSVGTELFDADRRMDRHYKANSRFLRCCGRTWKVRAFGGRSSKEG